MFVKYGCPCSNKDKIWQNLSVLRFGPTPPPGACDVSELWVNLKLLNWLTVQICLLYDHPNFKYCTLYVSGTELQTNKRTNRQTDGNQITRCPQQTFHTKGITCYSILFGRGSHCDSRLCQSDGKKDRWTDKWQKFKPKGHLLCWHNKNPTITWTRLTYMYLFQVKGKQTARLNVHRKYNFTI